MMVGYAQYPVSDNICLLERDSTSLCCSRICSNFW